jgi:hypothetical protein
MKKISTESKEGKVSHMSLLFRAFFIVVLALICIFAMPLSAFARFTANVILVPDNFVTSPTYNLNIQVTCDGAAVTVTNGKFTAAAGKEYEITMQYVPGSAKTGYCAVNVGSTSYTTTQIGADTTTALTFKIIGGSSSKTVQMTPKWSTSARHAEFLESGVNGAYYITEGESISA